jgi:preprotein translocase subunit SecG
VFISRFHIKDHKMFTIIAILIVLVCIVMTLVVLAQSSKGDGLSGTLGGPGSVGAVFGVRRASDFLQKTTIWLGGSLVVLCIIANLFFLPTAGSRPSAVQSGQAPTPATQQAPPAQQPSAPAAPPSNAGGQPGTGQTSPDNSPMPKQ